MPLSNQLPTLMNPSQGLIGYYPPQTGLMTAGMTPQAQIAPMGPWSKLAYQMAGSPKQGGGYASVPVPPGPAGSGGSSGGPSTGSSILTGLLGALAQNPSIIKNLGSSISGLLGSGAPAAGSIGSIMAGGSPALASVGAPAVSELPSVTAAVDAAAPSSAAPAAGLLGSVAAPAASSTLGAGAPGVFASGNAAAGSGTAAGTGSLGAAGTAAVVAAPFIFQQLGLMAGGAWANEKQQAEGNALMKNWMQSTGAQYVPVPGQKTSGAGGAFAGVSGAQTKNQWVDKNGKPMSAAQVKAAMLQYAQANGLPTGDFHG